MPSVLWLPARRHLGELAEQVPALRRVLSTATRQADQGGGATALMSDVFDALPSPMPAAALTRRVDAPDDCAGRWLRADPCHLRVEIAGVRMLACSDLALSPEEVAGLASAVRPLFDDAGWRFDAAQPKRWYAQPETAHPPIGGDAPEAVLGAYIDTALPQGEAGRATRRWLNELQMALHDHPLNHARRERGLPEVNSLWLHGDGAVLSSLSARVDAVWSQDALVLGCAALAGVHESDLLSSRRLLIDARLGDDASARHVAKVLSRGESTDISLASGERFAWRPWHRLRFWRGEPQ